MVPPHIPAYGFWCHQSSPNPSAFQCLESLCLLSGSLNLLVCFCSSPACWRCKRETSTALCPSAPPVPLRVVLGTPGAPLFLGQCPQGPWCAFWGVLELSICFLVPLPLEICWIKCLQETSMCSVGHQNYQSHHTAVRQGQDPQSHSHLHRAGTADTSFLSQLPMSWCEAEGQDESWICSRWGEPGLTPGTAQEAALL